MCGQGKRVMERRDLEFVEDLLVKIDNAGSCTLSWEECARLGGILFGVWFDAREEEEHGA
jgi:hypothetical protein